MYIKFQSDTKILEIKNPEHRSMLAKLVVTRKFFFNLKFDIFFVDFAHRAIKYLFDNQIKILFPDSVRGSELKKLF